MYKLIKKCGRARRGEFVTPNGTVKLPGFMNVATCGAIKGGVSAIDLKALKCQVQLCNTYHLHLRPGDKVVNSMGGIRKFTGWDGPVLTDSGGFQVFSLAKLRKINEEGVEFSSHIDGHKIFMGPEQSMQIQSNLASTIAMAFDECIKNPAEYSYTKQSCDRTFRWLKRCKAEMNRLNSLDTTINKKQMLFGINQGSTYKDIRIDHMKQIRELDLDGYAIGGLAVGEPAEEMYAMIEVVNRILPQDKPRYLMGVGTPENILEGIQRGVDMFDCVMPTRNGRNGMIFTTEGTINIKNQKWERDFSSIDPAALSYVDTDYSKAYLRHLIKSDEILGLQICSIHNLSFYLWLVREARKHIQEGDFVAWKTKLLPKITRRL